MSPRYDNHIYWDDIPLQIRRQYKLTRESQFWAHPSRGPLRIEHGKAVKQNVIARHRRFSGTTL